MGLITFESNDLGTSLFYWTAFKGAKSAIFKGNCVTNQSFSVFEGLINGNKWFLIGSLDVCIQRTHDHVYKRKLWNTIYEKMTIYKLKEVLDSQYNRSDVKRHHRSVLFSFQNTVTGNHSLYEIDSET